MWMKINPALLLLLTTSWSVPKQNGRSKQTEQLGLFLTHSSSPFTGRELQSVTRCPAVIRFGELGVINA